MEIFFENRRCAKLRGELTLFYALHRRGTLAQNGVTLQLVRDLAEVPPERRLKPPYTVWRDRLDADRLLWLARHGRDGKIPIFCIYHPGSENAGDTSTKMLTVDRDVFAHFFTPVDLAEGILQQDRTP